MFLGEMRQPGGKIVSAWALPGDLDVSVVRSNTFTMEWPPRSGRTGEFPEVDRAGWFDVEDRSDANSSAVSSGCSTGSPSC